MQKYLASPFFQSLSAPRTDPFFMAVTNAPTGGSKIREPNFLRISEGAQHSRQKAFATLDMLTTKARYMNDPNVESRPLANNCASS